MACPIENPVTSPVGWIPVSECLVLPFLCRRPVAGTGVRLLGEGGMGQLTLGTDVACRAARQASLAD